MHLLSPKEKEKKKQFLDLPKFAIEDYGYAEFITTYDRQLSGSVVDRIGQTKSDIEHRFRVYLGPVSWIIRKTFTEFLELKDILSTIDFEFTTDE
jgi:hypothetical protein